MNKATLLKLHRWSGLVFGVLLLLQGLTGTLLVFRDEIELLIHPALTVVPEGEPLPLQTLIDTARVAHPSAVLDRVAVPEDSDGTVRMMMRERADRSPYIAAIDPYRGTIVRAGGLSAWPGELLFRIHETLLAGDIGDAIVGIEGIALVLMAITGLIVWWPGRKRLKQGFRILRGNGTDRLVRTMHRAAGAALAALLLVSAATGALMVFKADLIPLISWVTPYVPKPSLKVAEEKGRALVPVDTLIARARRDYGDTPLVELRFSGKVGQGIAVYLRDPGSARSNAARQIYYDGYTGAELGHYVPAALPAANSFIDWLYVVHIGTAAGLPGRLLILCSGAGLVFFAASGLWLWFSSRRQKRERQAKAAARRSAAPAQGNP